MASHQYQPSSAPPVAPLAFLPSSFALQEATGELPPPFVGGAAGGAAGFGYPPPPAFGGAAFGGGSASGYPPMKRGGSMSTFGAHSFDDEPPLLEGTPVREPRARGGPDPRAELGIDVVHIFKKTRATLRQPWFRADSSALEDDGDLAGPLLYAVLLGVSHLLARCPEFYRVGGP